MNQNVFYLVEFYVNNVFLLYKANEGNQRMAWREFQMALILKIYRSSTDITEDYDTHHLESMLQSDFVLASYLMFRQFCL